MMKNLIVRCRKLIWAIIVAYMVGIHNIYFQEQKSPNDIGIKLEEDHQISESAPNE